MGRCYPVIAERLCHILIYRIMVGIENRIQRTEQVHKKLKQKIERYRKDSVDFK